MARQRRGNCSFLLAAPNQHFDSNSSCRSTSSNTSTTTTPTNTLSILVPGLSVGRTPAFNPGLEARTARLTRVSSEASSQLSARALAVTTLAARSSMSKEVLVLPSTWLPVVSSPCFGITRPLQSGDSSGLRYLKTFRTVTLTLRLGELPLLCGLKTRAISPLLSVTSAVCPSRSPARDLAKLFTASSSCHQHRHLW